MRRSWRNSDRTSYGGVYGFRAEHTIKPDTMEDIAIARDEDHLLGHGIESLLATDGQGRKHE